jgi:hypothetical protein
MGATQTVKPSAVRRLVELNHGRLLVPHFGLTTQQVAPGCGSRSMHQAERIFAGKALLSDEGLIRIAPATLTWNIQFAEESVIPHIAASCRPGAQIVEMKQKRATLEEIYFKLQGRQEEGLA